MLLSHLSDEEPLNYSHANLSPLLIGLCLKVFLRKEERRELSSQFYLHAFSLYSLQTIAELHTKEIYMHLLQVVSSTISPIRLTPS